MVKPVYVFSGFLDSGKTRSIKTSLYDQRFNQGERTLIIAFEQGDEDFDNKFLKSTNSQVIYMNSINELTIEKQKEIDKAFNVDRIFIELNGMEDDNILYNTGFNANWELAQTLTTIDASKFNLYINNMRQFMYYHVEKAECAIVNRSDDVDKRFLRNNLKSINQRLEIIFEDKDGNVSTYVAEDLFDTSKDINVEDSDYGLWYMDALDNAYKYDGKKITIKAKKCGDDNENQNVLIMGRQAMVCCANDIQNIALSVVCKDSIDVKEDQYYYLTGTIHALKDEENYDVCVLYLEDIKEADKPSEELVYFN